MSQQDLLVVESQLRKIHELSHFLPKLAEVVDFEMFRPDLSVLREVSVKGCSDRIHRIHLFGDMV
jgi:hypothetical protein